MSAELNVPAEVVATVEAAVAAHRAWLAAPLDHDHHIRHAAADEAGRASRRLHSAVDQWVAVLAGQQSTSWKRDELLPAFDVEDESE